MEGFPILSLMLLVPMLGAAACLFAGDKAARVIALTATLIDLALGIVLWASYDIGGAQWQFTERAATEPFSTTQAAPSGPKRSMMPSSPPFQNTRPSQKAGRTNRKL